MEEGIRMVDRLDRREATLAQEYHTWNIRSLLLGLAGFPGPAATER